ncbi:MAG: hypothetical protein KF746_23240 [Chitinophagaceae bacterium]|nr:hypothetical protein [Chitinophagaceae bacterium]
MNKTGWLLVFFSLTAACNKNDIRGIPPGQGAIVYKQVNQLLSYEHPVALYVDDDHTPDIVLSNVLLEHNNKPYLVLTVRGASQSGNKSMLSNQPDITGNSFWASPLQEGFTIFENATGNRNWSNPNENGYLAAIMDDGNQTEYNGLWIGKQKRYLGISLLINGHIHFGWICMSHSANSKQIQVHDMAYNKKPGGVIKAGQQKELFEGLTGQGSGKD